ncbi:MAG: hypothetical protein R3C03_10355 [Pirellulaceae bacterium]
MSDILIRPDLHVEVEVSKYDRLSALLSAALMIVGFLVSFLFLIWLTSIIKFNRSLPTPYVAEQPAGDEKPEGVEDDILEPGVEEFPEVEVPQLAMALEAVTNALSSVRANMEHRSGDAAQMGKGRGLGSRNGGDGTGSGDVVPEHKRWKIEYQASNVDTYAKMLSFFHIDVGLVYTLNNDIIRLVDPGGVANIVRTSRAAEKKSVYFAHEKAQLQRFDNALFKRKGVETRETFTVQFYPEPTKEILRQLEGAYLQRIDRKLKEVQNTFFKVVPTPTGYEFVVTDIKYRRR